MRAIVYETTGASDVLALVDREPVAPGAGEVQVRVVVSGVNPTDWKSRAGSTGGAPAAAKVPNQDGAGFVVAVGDGVDGLVPGDRVWLWDVAQVGAEGTAQELVTLPAEHVVPLPAGASFDQGASLGIPALTAHRTLTVHDDGPARLAPGALAGRTVLVQGGAGAVGHAAIQLARWAGATVVTTVSGPHKAALARAAGAQHVVDYRREDVVAAVRAVAPGGADVVVEVAPNENLATDLELLATGGVVAVYASTGDEPLAVPVRPNMGRNLRLQFVLTYTVTPAQKRAAVEAVSAALADGALGVGVEHGLPLTRFPFERTADAHDAVAGGTVGKVLVDVTAPDGTPAA